MAEPTDTASTPSLPPGTTSRRITLVPQADGTLRAPATRTRHATLLPDGKGFIAAAMSADELLRHGWALQQQGRLQQAEAAYRECLGHQPPSPKAMNNLATVLGGLGRHAEAEAVLRELIALQPGYSTALLNLGLELVLQGRPDEAVVALRKVLASEPLNAGAWSTLAGALAALDRAVEAESALERALSLAPQDPRPRVIMGGLLGRAGRLQSSEKHLRDGLALSPSAFDAQCNLGMVLLAQGRYEEGWPFYEARLQLHPSRRPMPATQQWSGEPLAGRSLLLWHEQGYGDTIQFVRYAAMLKARGAGKVTLAVPAPLLRLLAHTPGVDAVVPYGNPPPPHDCWVALTSLASCFGTTLAGIPAQLPYLRASPDLVQTWRERLPRGLRVGLAWAGSPTHANDRHRSLPGLESLMPLWGAAGVTFVSVQKDKVGDSSGQDALRVRPGQPLVALGTEMQDFADLAAILSQLDLLVSVDTAAAHLAAALGKPVWLLLPSWAVDWRWLRDRDDSPWYPKVMRLYRQQSVGDWVPAIERVASDLSAWAADKAHRTAAPRRRSSRKA